MHSVVQRTVEALFFRDAVATKLRRRAGNGIPQLKLVVLCGLLLLAQLGAARAEEPAEQATRHVEAGEFAPARRIAEELPEREIRNDLLMQIAAAQQAVGDRPGFARTLGSIDDDQLRSSLLQQYPAQAGNPGGVQADFDSLIDLIVSTIAPDSWEDVGGPGAIREFPGGVYVDAVGTLQRSEANRVASLDLAVVREAGAPARDLAATSPRRSSALRKVSLPRLEKHLQVQAALGELPGAEAKYLAGLYDVKYLLLYPETGDLVIAGPAGDWRIDAEGRAVNVETGRPVLQLDDLVVLLRHFTLGDAQPIGCKIEPTQDALARTQQFLAKSQQRPLRRGQREAWLEQVRSAVGRQNISVFGVDADTRVARLLVEADYRMKLVGMGLEDGTLNVPSYLEMIEVPRGQAPPPFTVLRWWFALRARALEATPELDAFGWRTGSVRVLSENELLDELGQRIHTGESDPLNAEFARNFTEHYEELAAKYPVYADLENVFNLALVASAIRVHRLADRVGWHLSGFADPAQYQVARAAVPKQVDSVINHRMVNRVHIVAGVSGGVSLDPLALISESQLKREDYGLLAAERAAARGAPAEAGEDRWWWD